MFGLKNCGKDGIAKDQVGEFGIPEKEILEYL